MILAPETRRNAVCLIVFIACLMQAHAQDNNLPSLGSPVPIWVVKARIQAQTCLTDVRHRDPCATVTVKKMRFKIAWDERTSAVTFLFTADHHLITDSELGVGGGCRLVDQFDTPYKLTAYLDWVFTPMWMDSVQDLSGDAAWYAALRKDPAYSDYGKIAGFLQSRYLKIDE